MKRLVNAVCLTNNRDEVLRCTVRRPMTIEELLITIPVPLLLLVSCTTCDADLALRLPSPSGPRDTATLGQPSASCRSGIGLETAVSVGGHRSDPILLRTLTPPCYCSSGFLSHCHLQEPGFYQARPQVVAWCSGKPLDPSPNIMSSSYTHLIIVCCHAIWLGGPTAGDDESEW